MDSRENETQWPETKKVPNDGLAQKILEFCQELNRRKGESRDRSLAAAEAIWPILKAALREKGRKIGLNGLAEPILPHWAQEPVVAIAGYYGNKPKTKAGVMEIALSVGDGSWATIGDLWLWVGGGGPIVDRTLQKYGFLRKPEDKPAKGSRR